MATARKAPLGASLIVLSSIFYASYGIWVALMGDFFGGYMASALRGVLVLVILLPLAIFGRKFGPIDWRRNWPPMLGIFISASLVWGSLYYAITHAGVGLSLSINYAALVIGMFFFGWLFMKERFTKDKWLSTILGFIGLWLVFSPNVSGVGAFAMGAAFLSGFAGSLSAVMWKRLPYSATQTSILVWTISVVASLPLSFLLGESTPNFGWHIEWLYLVFFAVASTLSVWTNVLGLKYVEAGASGILGLLEIVFAVLFGVVFFSERPDMVALVGIAAIIAAAAIPYVKDYNAQRGTLEDSE